MKRSRKEIQRHNLLHWAKKELCDIVISAKDVIAENGQPITGYGQFYTGGNNG